MNDFERALRNKKRHGCLLKAFAELYGEENITPAIIQGIMNSIEIRDNKDLVSLNEGFAGVPDLAIVVDVAEEGGKLGYEHFDVNKHFPIAMNTRDTVGVLFGDDYCCAVLGYDIKHELYVIKFDTIEEAPLDISAYPQEGPNAFVVKASELASYGFEASAVFMIKHTVQHNV